MQRAAIPIRFAFVTLTAFVVAPSQPRANVLHEHDVTVNQRVRASSPDDPEASQASVNREPTRRASMEEICATLVATADAHELPLPFFVRLIWQESGFRSDVVSRAGARGIAQFMPATARERGLTDPRDPIQSLRKSADFLRELRNQFGNLGLAAAAYNSGPGRVQSWLNGRGGLPSETRHYVQIVTGAPAEAWRGREHASAVQTDRIPEKIPCPALVAVAQQQSQEDGEPVAVTGSVHRAAPGVRARTPNEAGWAVVLAGSFSRNKAGSQSARLQRRFGSVLKGRKPKIINHRIAGRGKARMTQVRISESDRASAERLCARLRAGGANCLVMRAS